MRYEQLNRRANRSLRILAGLLLLAFAACTNTSAKHILSGTAPVPVMELHRSNTCGTQGEATQIHFFANAAELQAAQAALHPDWFSGSIPELEYALIELGERKTPGYDILISSRAEFHDGMLELTGTFLTPPTPLTPAEMPIQTDGSSNASSPCVLIALPKLNPRGVILLDPSGVARARAHPPTATPPAAIPATATAGPEFPASSATPEAAGSTPKSDEAAPAIAAPEAAPGSAAAQVSAPPAQ